MRLAKIEGGVVTNVIEVDGDAVPDWAAAWIEAPQAGPGWTWDGTSFAPPVLQGPGVPIPESISFAQMLIGLVAEAWITEAEGNAWLAGTLPAPVEALIATLPADQRFAARARAARPSIVRRSDPLLVALGAAQGKTPEQLDAFFTTYAQA